MKIPLSLLMILFFLSCSNHVVEIENINKGKLKSSKTLKETDVKKFPLDSVTAPNPKYIQIYKDINNKRNLTFLNSYNNSIYFYNYQDLSFLKKISFDKKGPNGIFGLLGYHIQNLDSIYAYDNSNLEIVIANGDSEILSRHSLIGNKDFRKSNWAQIYPQYYPTSIVPFINVKDNLFLAGFFIYNSSKESIKKSKHTLRFNKINNNVSFEHTYPEELYRNFNWGDPLYKIVYPVYNPNKNELVYSYPVSHHLYRHNLSTNQLDKVHASSNFAGTITSFDASEKKRIPKNRIGLKFNQQDIYGGLLYDKWSKVYYRFMLKALPNVTVKTNSKKKKVVVIIMDENFNYLGEKVLGTWRNWNWENSFVTEEGLNIEFLDNHNINEVALIFKIFQPKDI
ncbi:DUF4221 family protein [uncultured Algibacter sp.]|uniref:DUF4221 family protein n=1 Tax=uncultured Algibacter sp. TaxID=298659 RepID=UPI002631056F|nr:DUF4221 family protein [uncultured Algibacter sp.]